jgi:Domain of unknown function (DUF4192)
MPTPMVLRDPADVLSLVPYLLGFHPADSVVVLGARGGQMIFQARGDLADAVQMAEHYAAVLGRQQVTSAIVIGYGEAVAVTPAVLAVARCLTETGIYLRDALRVTAGRYWSYLCQSLECCPPEGIGYDTAASVVTTTAVVNGHVALPSRADLESRLAPLDPLTRAGMRAATERADRRLADLLGAAGPDPSAALRAAGVAAVRAAVARQRADGQLDDDEVAWLSVLLVHPPARDDAWAAVEVAPERHVRLWSEVLRRAEPRVRAAPATLLGFAAWQAGDGIIAGMAVQRALAADPDYVMARLLGEVIAGGVPPGEWKVALRRMRARG